MLPDPIETTPVEPIVGEPPVLPRDPFWGYMDLALVVGLAFGLIAVVATVAVVSYHGVLPIESPGFVVASNVVAYLCIYLAFLVVFRLRYRKPVFSSLGWVRARYNVLTVVLGGIALAFLVSGLALVLRTPKVDSQLERLMESRAALALLGPMAVTIAPFFEELFFRGFLQPLLSRSLGIIAGISITAIAFGSLHAPEYDWAWQYALIITLVGAVLGWIRARTGSIIPGTVLHACYNAVFVVAAVYQHPK